MLQQIIALIIIFLFISRLVRQKNRQEIGSNELYLWLSFWILAAISIIFIKFIDRFVAYFGFSMSGINFLLYLSVLALFYLVFRLRLNLAKLDKNLTEVVRQLTLNKK
ncbi:DUF2304 family protein [Candidatus Falkowbacteria bacterium]|uniref:DUF2304 domain-containing protein n=1 Tax=Candidatus Falkowbacteria bacterium CG10_big_fil_rev_8_21_14_0_10_37_18 TaxID=1974562 RepID=A0A2H0V925_9BACT|nr:DUF2304 family protein [Candidatus Falkowbacteria bacterium]NCQ12576.1 DUF2304 family protein [Candidatus Falkowbacteria bacterium]OIO05596.1 MAG: hypothetical protein AUJ26_02840 [Candidatus Falkowbacteria bacterium CG1_02_37_21]PIR95561.1 MAG: hypothetical protein COT93_02010 [Candidatus Falkowbacteria bacterium CG10_big_fil_rev_8_21_14_0_10_37_18]